MDEGIPLTRTVRGNAARETARRALHLASLLLAPAPFVLAVLAIALSHDVDILILAALVVVWNASGALLALRYPAEHLGQVVLWASFVAGAGTAGIALLSHGTAAAQFAHLMRPLSLALLPAAALHLFLALPDGVVEGRAWRVTVAAGYLVGAAIGAVYAAQAEDVPLALVALEVVPAAVAAWIGSNQRYWRVSGRERQRMQWFGWAMTVALGIGLIAIAARILVGWPAHEGQIIAAATFPVPLALSLGTSSRLVHRIDRLLTGTISLVGLCGVVVAVYLAIVLGLGRVPNEQEGGLLFLSMVAAGVSALLYHPARRWLVSFAERRVYGEQREPRTVLSTFGSRLSRAIPLDELLLQLVEALHRSLSLSCAEVWIGAEGSMELAASVPEKAAAHLALGSAERPVVARAAVMGPAWMRIWVPPLLEGRPEGAPVRVSPITHAGELLGLIVVERPPEGDAFDEAEEQSISELARQVGLALHNVQLDSALQSSLEEVRRQAEELQASRKRIVAAGDAERRKLERNLHDGAQQRLVALSVKVKLIERLASSDAEKATTMLRELGDDLKEAVTELRSLAHGIYPPLLMDRGLGEALRAAAGRAALPTVVEADGIGRYPQEVEAAAYFCCLEALQNAGKHAGEGASATVRLWEDAGALLFEVADDGAGFDPKESRRGAGFVNMGDRIGSIGGRLDVEAAVGHGVRVRGRIPVTAAA